jgi:tRNA G10  N-methylase Trm11
MNSLRKFLELEENHSQAPISIAEQTRQNRARNISKPALNENGKPVLTSVWIPSTEQLHEYRTDPFLKSIKLTGRTFPHVVENLVLLYSDEGDIVYDPMMGTGTTLYIADRLNRFVTGSDLNLERVSKFIERWKEYVGTEAPKVTQASAAKFTSEV